MQELKVPKNRKSGTAGSLGRFPFGLSAQQLSGLVRSEGKARPSGSGRVEKIAETKSKRAVAALYSDQSLANSVRRRAGTVK